MADLAPETGSMSHNRATLTLPADAISLTIREERARHGLCSIHDWVGTTPPCGRTLHGGGADDWTHPPSKTRQTMTTLARWNPITRWNPTRELEELQSRLSNILDFPTLRKDGERESLAIAEWAPAVDITEDEKEYLVKAEIPEVKKEDVKVTVENNLLTISGERKFEKEEKGKKYHRIERSYGSFVRSFSLPDDVDSSKVDAKFTDGVLTVHVAKSEAARPKQIEVKVA